MKILTDKYPDYKRVILDAWSTKVAVSSTYFIALIDSIACEHPMHFMPFQGPFVILPTSFSLNIAVGDSLATGMYELRQVSPLGSLVLSWSPGKAHAPGDKITPLPCNRANGTTHDLRQIRLHRLSSRFFHSSVSNKPFVGDFFLKACHQMLTFLNCGRWRRFLRNISFTICLISARESLAAVSGSWVMA